MWKPWLSGLSSFLTRPTVCARESVCIQMQRGGNSEVADCQVTDIGSGLHHTPVHLSPDAQPVTLSTPPTLSEPQGLRL